MGVTNNNVEQFDIIYKGEKYNIQDFLYKHPGGTNYLKPYQNKDVMKSMQEHTHSKAAFYMLREFKTGGRDTKDDEFSEDLEKLVDWNKPMMAQLCTMGTRYNDWVNAPVDRKLILFGNKYLEMLTVTPWFVVPTIWIPIISYILYMGVLQFGTENIGPFPAVVPIISTLAFGITLWTLVEYLLHRFLFHLPVPDYSKVLIYVHFVLHGLHHKVPFDHLRLVFPPIPAAGIAIILYKLIICNAFPAYMTLLITAGALIGYLMYDMVHFYLHYGNPKEGNYMYDMKRFHNHHHFIDPTNGFGLSSKEWDRVFGTSITVPKIAKPINWDKI